MSLTKFSLAGKNLIINLLLGLSYIYLNILGRYHLAMQIKSLYKAHSDLQASHQAQSIEN
jgi:hypothetical protein